MALLCFYCILTDSVKKIAPLFLLPFISCISIHLLSPAVVVVIYFLLLLTFSYNMVPIFAVDVGTINA